MAANNNKSSNAKSETRTPFQCLAHIFQDGKILMSFQISDMRMVQYGLDRVGKGQADVHFFSTTLYTMTPGMSEKDTEDTKKSIADATEKHNKLTLEYAAIKSLKYTPKINPNNKRTKS
jgi:hypothetical protein